MQLFGGWSRRQSIVSSSCFSMFLHFVAFVTIGRLSRSRLCTIVSFHPVHGHPLWLYAANHVHRICGAQVLGVSRVFPGHMNMWAFRGLGHLWGSSWFGDALGTHGTLPRLRATFLLPRLKLQGLWSKDPRWSMYYNFVSLVYQRTSPWALSS